MLLGSAPASPGLLQQLVGQLNQQFVEPQQSFVQSTHHSFPNQVIIALHLYQLDILPPSASS